MKNLTPYLKALKAFETAARHRSFAAAAEELFVTPAAVGQLVKQLESQLGLPLFHRNAGGQNRIAPTEAAARALPDIQAGFTALQRGLDALAQGNKCRLTVTLSPAFAAKWLMPRLERFQAACPDLDLRLHTDLRVLDYADHDIDIGIRYGRGNWAGLTAQKLMGEELYPVCSPAFLAAHPLAAPEQLLSLPLIHDVSLTAADGFTGWRGWLAQAGVQPAMLRPGLNINNSAAVLQAAAEGQGIALARSVMAQDDLAAGRLVRLFPAIEYPSPLAYYIATPAQTVDSPKLVAFKQWLREEAARG
ncbi:LysR family transcriptional regulator [Neisseria sp. HMSC071C03]|nr:LysR family transcriptional regulator [Neisseria sp. HMSC071B12]OHR51390.1 LysR family transcriptional regulator [Neisseria sp. HMSC071C03]